MRLIIIHFSTWEHNSRMRIDDLFSNVLYQSLVKIRLFVLFLHNGQHTIIPTAIPG